MKTAIKARLRYYPAYNAIPLRSRRQIEDNLHLRKGWMLYFAAIGNPPCVVAFSRKRAIGWTTVLPRGTWNRYRRSIQVFVLPRFRRNGVGTKLIERLMERCQLFGKNVAIANNQTKQAQRFFKAIGFVSPTPRNEKPHRNH